VGAQGGQPAILRLRALQRRVHVAGLGHAAGKIDVQIQIHTRPSLISRAAARRGHNLVQFPLYGSGGTIASMKKPHTRKTGKIPRGTPRGKGAGFAAGFQPTMRMYRPITSMNRYTSS